jgi:hypothetical protein
LGQYSSWPLSSTVSSPHARSYSIWGGSFSSRPVPARALAAEKLFLRKQLALFQERKVKPRPARDADRWLMASLSRIFPWREALLNVKPDTLIRWRRQGFRLFWRWKSKPTGRPLLPKNLRQLIREMGARESDLGRRADRRRVAIEARDPGLAPYRREIPAKRQTGAHTGPKAALAELCP